MALGNTSVETAVLIAKVERILSQITAYNNRLGAACNSTLGAAELRRALPVLQPVFELGDSLEERKLESVELEEALVYLRDTALCELLLSLLRRLPWAEIWQEHAILQEDLGLLLPKLLRALWSFLCASVHVRGSQQASAFAEMNKRCLPRPRPMF